MSKIYEFIRALPSEERHDDHVVKHASARDLVLCLPNPGNIKRDPDIIPDLPIKLVLSTTKKLPKTIADRVNASSDAGFFNDDSLLGLCMNGRKLPIEIFLHDVLMNKIDPTHDLFEEVFWHEYVHAAEGIIWDHKQEQYSRKKPWSYTLQQKMLKIDKKEGHDPFEGFDGPDELKRHTNYMRQGTPLQENVSEIFARAACIYMFKIKEKSCAPDFGEAAFLFEELQKKRPNSYKTRLDRNRFDLVVGLGTYSDKSKDMFFKSLSEMSARIHVLYGLNF